MNSKTDNTIKFTKKRLEDNREKKIELEYTVVEKIAQRFLERWSIEKEINDFIISQLNIDWKAVGENYRNRNKKKYNHQYQFTPQLFDDLDNFIRKLIRQRFKDEKEYLRKQKSPEDLKNFEAIIEINENEIPLTMFEKGISRYTLTTWHYLMKAIDYLIFKDNHIELMGFERTKSNKIRSVKNPIDLFFKEYLLIISKNEELTRFTLTIKSLIEQWFSKYNNKTKIAQFYFDVLMTTPEVVVERILKYTVFTAVKNKSPIVLRAVFSSYVTLIHKNLFSFYSTNLSTVKIGFFNQLEKLFTESFETQFDRGNKFLESKNSISLAFLYSFVNKHKNLQKRSLHFPEFIQDVFYINGFDLLHTYDKLKRLPFGDFLFYYTILKNTKNVSEKKVPEAYYLRLKIAYSEDFHHKKLQTYINDRLIDRYAKPFLQFFNSKETVLEIFRKLSDSIALMFDLRYFIDVKNRKYPPAIDYGQYYRKIDDTIETLKNLIDFKNIEEIQKLRLIYKTYKKELSHDTI